MLFSSNNKDLLSKAANIVSHAAVNNQEIPSNILIAITNSLSLFMDIPALVIAFYELINATNHNNDEVTKLAENLLISEKSSAATKEYGRMALKILTVRGKYLSLDTMEYISLSLQDTALDDKVLIDFSHILHNVVSNGQTLTKNGRAALIYSLHTNKPQLHSNAISCFKELSSYVSNFSDQELSLIKSFLQKDTIAKIQHDILKILKNISIHTGKRFVETELEEAINFLNSNPDDSLNAISSVVALLEDVEFISNNVTEILKKHLAHKDLQVANLSTRGLAIIAWKGNQLIFTTEQIDKLSFLLQQNHDHINNTDLVILLEHASASAEPLSRGSLIRLIACLESNSNTLKPKIKAILENENGKSKFDRQLTDLFYLAIESSDIRPDIVGEKKLLQIIKILKSKIAVNQELSRDQYDILSYGLKHSNPQIAGKSKECLKFLSLNPEFILNESFAKSILPILEGKLLLIFISKLLISNGQEYESLLNDTITKFEILVDKDSNLSLSKEILKIIDFLVEQKLSLSPKIISYVEQCLDNRASQIAAFKVLKKQADQGGYNLSDRYLDILNKLAVNLEFECKAFSKELQATMTPHERVSILIALLNVKYINNEVLSKLPSHKYWVRELLTYDLAMRARVVDSYDLEVFDANLIRLEKQRNYDLVCKERDDLLLTLINLQQEYGYNLNQINHILELLIDLPTNILSILSKTKDIEYDLRLTWLKSKFFPNLEGTELQLLYQGFFIQNNWPISIIESFLLSLPIGSSVPQISSFLRFIQENDISFEKINELLTESFEIYEDNLLNKWQEILTKNILKIYLTEQFSKVPNHTTEGEDLIKLLSVGWSIKAIKELCNNILLKSHSNFQNLQNILKAIQIVQYYKITEDFTSKDGLTVLKVVRECNLDDIEIVLHQLAIQQNFQTSSEKDIETLLNEIAVENQNDQSIQTLIANNTLKYEIQDIERKYNSNSTILLNDKLIKQWSKEDIQSWSNLIKGSLAKLPQYRTEILAVIKQACILDSAHEPRVVQQLSVLLMLHPEGTGRLVQISTGEGKSMSVAMLAVVKALCNEVVDIVTSSPVLARRDAEEKSFFYSMFNLTVKDNDDSGYANPEKKDCYTKNIVYGSVENFQFDLLRSMHQRLDIRKDRTFGIVIIDEVDSMLIDEGSKIAKLSTPLPQMEYLEHLLSLAWQHLEKIDEHFYYDCSNKQLSWIRCDFTVEKGELHLADSSYEDNAVEVHNRLEYTKFLLQKYLKQYINQSEGCFVVPSHLRDFALQQIDEWITSAIYAKHVFHEGKHYLISKGNHKSNKIVPIDFANTGILQFKTSWSDGLHQFLEIKHGLKVSAENLTTSFISNMGFFNKYGQNIFGMTGTLGNKDTHQLLKNIYPIQISFIPTYKVKQFIELPGIVAVDSENWIQEIVASVISEAKKGRAILVICETINDAEKIKHALVSSNYPLNKINRYARNDNEEYLAINHNLDSEEVILATNLAGRGTDLKTTEQVEKAGGLHVCLTFLPDNQRVEQQAFGRTSRQGKSGTGQLVIDEMPTLLKLSYNHVSIKDIGTIKDLRDSIEQARLQKISHLELYKTLISDELFSSFNELYQSLKKEEKLPFKLQQLEELWGFWLHKFDLDESSSINLSKISFHYYLKEMKLKAHSVISGIDSFYYSIIHQLKYLHIETTKAKDIDGLKQIIINHLIANPLLYNDATSNLEQFASDYFHPAKWQDDIFIKAVSRIFGVNIILIKSDNSYKYHRTIGATETLYIAYEIEGDYSSLVKDDLSIDYEERFQTNIEVDHVTVVDSKVRDNTNTKLQCLSILEYFSVLGARQAVTAGEQKQQQARIAYQQFKEEILAKYTTTGISKNPSYDTLQANMLLRLNCYEQAIEHYNKAITLDTIYSFVAHYNKAYATASHGRIAEPKGDLLTAKDQIEGHLIPQLESMQMLLVSDSDIAINSELIKQITNKINLLKLKLNYIHDALSVIASVEQKNEKIRHAIATGKIKEKNASTFTIAVSKTQKLKDLYEQVEIPEEEILELEHLGLEHLFTISEVEIMPEKDDSLFGSIFGCVLGIGQVVFGAIIAACGGVAFGISMIIEGVKDLYTVVTGGFSHGFSIKKYFSSKAVNYTVSAIAMGWDNFKAGIEAVKTGATTAAASIKNTVVKTFGGAATTQGRLEASKNAAPLIAKEGLFSNALAIAKQEVPKAIVSVGAQQVVSFIADTASDAIIKEFRGEIGGSVKKKISEVINSDQTASIVDRSLLVDTMLGGNKFTALIMREVALILKPEEHEFIKAAASIIKAITDKYHSSITTAISIAEKVATINKILNVADRFCHKLVSKLDTIARNLPDNQTLFHMCVQRYLTRDDSNAIYDTLITNKILNNEGRVIEKDLSKINEINFGANNKLQLIILNFCVKLQQLQNANSPELRTKIITYTQQMITGRIMQLVKAEILSPTINSGITHLSNALVDKLHKASAAAKAGVREEMNKYYNRVELSKDNEEHNRIFHEPASKEENIKNPVAAASKGQIESDIKQKPTEGWFIPDTEGSLYLDSIAHQMGKAIYLYRDNKLEKIFGAQYQGAPSFNLDYITGFGWKKRDFPYNNQQFQSLYELICEEANSDNSSIVFEKSQDPRVQFHSPYTNYVKDGKMVDQSKINARLQSKMPKTRQHDYAGKENNGYEWMIGDLVPLFTSTKPKPPSVLPKPRSILFKDHPQGASYDASASNYISDITAGIHHSSISNIPKGQRPESSPIDSVESLSNADLEREYTAITNRTNYVLFGPDEHGKAILAEYKKRFPGHEGERNVEVLGAALTNPSGIIPKLVVEKVTGSKLSGEVDPTDWAADRLSLIGKEGFKTKTPKAKGADSKEAKLNQSADLTLENSATTSKIEHKLAAAESASTSSKLKVLDDSLAPLTAKDKIVENPYLAKNYVRQIEEITKLPIEEKQLGFLKEALQTQEFCKLPEKQRDKHRARFDNIKVKLREEWEQNTGKKWPAYASHPDPERIGGPYDAHHIIQLDHGGPNIWWNIHPADGVVEHKRIHGTGSKANEIFKPKKK